MAKVIYTTDTDGNTVMKSPSGKSISSPYSSNGGSFVTPKEPEKPKTETRYVYVDNTPAPSGHSGGDGNVDYIKQKLKEQEEAAKAYYKTLYEQELLNNKNDWERNRNQLNRNYLRADRYLRNLYGNQVSGAGLSNRARNYSNWNSGTADALQSYTNNDANSLAQYNQNLSNVGKTMAQGWYNYVLPIYTNRQIHDDEYAYRRWLAQL